MPYCDDVLTVKVRPEAWNAADVNDIVTRHGARLRAQFGCIRTFALTVPPAERDFILRALYDDPRVERVGLSAKGGACAAFTHSGAVVASTGMATAYDAHRGGVLRRLNVFAAWQDTRGTSTKPGLTPVGHVDIGLRADIFPGKTFTTWSVPDQNAAGAFSLSSDDHGSMTGSILYGNIPDGNNANAFGHVGVAPDLEHVVYVRMSYSYADTSVEATEGFQFCWDHGAKIISLSSRYTNDDPALRDLCQFIYDNGGLIVTSAGNDHAPTVAYPGWYDTTINVGGTTYGDEAWGAGANYWTQMMTGRGSNYGPQVDCAAIADTIPIGLRNAGNQWKFGTSFATPAVAGVCYLIHCINPALTGAQIRQILLSTVDKAHRGWWFYGFFTKDAAAEGFPGVGIPDAAKAVAKAKATLSEHAGVVIPYLRLHSARSSDQFDSDYSAHQWWSEGVSEVLSDDGTVDVFAEGPVGWELTGFSAAGPVTEVELWIDGVKEYQGPPTDPWVGLLLREEHRNRLWQLKIVARTATGEVGERTYTTDLSGVPMSTGSETYELDIDTRVIRATVGAAYDEATVTLLTEARALAESTVQPIASSAPRVGARAPSATQAAAQHQAAARAGARATSTDSATTEALAAARPGARASADTTATTIAAAGATTSTAVHVIRATVAGAYDEALVSLVLSTEASAAGDSTSRFQASAEAVPGASASATAISRFQGSAEVQTTPRSQASAPVEHRTQTTAAAMPSAGAQASASSEVLTEAASLALEPRRVPVPKLQLGLLAPRLWLDDAPGPDLELAPGPAPRLTLTLYEEA